MSRMYDDTKLLSLPLSDALFYLEEKLGADVLTIAEPMFLKLREEKNIVNVLAFFDKFDSEVTAKISSLNILINNACSSLNNKKKLAAEAAKKATCYAEIQAVEQDIEKEQEKANLFIDDKQTARDNLTCVKSLIGDMRVVVNIELCKAGAQSPIFVEWQDKVYQLKTLEDAGQSNALLYRQIEQLEKDLGKIYSHFIARGINERWFDPAFLPWTHRCCKDDSLDDSTFFQITSLRCDCSNNILCGNCAIVCHNGNGHKLSAAYSCQNCKCNHRFADEKAKNVLRSTTLPDCRSNNTQSLFQHVKLRFAMMEEKARKSGQFPEDSFQRRSYHRLAKWFKNQFDHYYWNSQDAVYLANFLMDIYKMRSRESIEFFNTIVDRDHSVDRCSCCSMIGFDSSRNHVSITTQQVVELKEFEDKLKAKNLVFKYILPSKEERGNDTEFAMNFTVIVSGAGRIEICKCIPDSFRTKNEILFEWQLEKTDKALISAVYYKATPWNDGKYPWKGTYAKESVSIASYELN